MFFSNTRWTQFPFIFTILSTLQQIFFNRKCYESAWKRTCVYIVQMHGEEESLSGQRLFTDHSWRIVEKGLVSGSENLKKKIVKHPLHHHMLFGRVSRKILLTHPKTISSIFSCQNTTGTSNGTGFYGQMKIKNELFSSKRLKMGLVNTGIKSTPCLQWNILLYF